MGHQIGKREAPRRGSLQYWPRKRAKRIYPRVRNWKGEGILGFAGYKAGMTHIIAIDNRKGSPTKGEKISIPVTILETPPLILAGVRFYKETPEGYKSIGEIWAENLDKRVERKVKRGKNKHKWEDFKEFDKVKLIVHTQPPFKKTPEIFEIGYEGDVESLKEMLGKPIDVEQVFKPGEQVDVIAVTKGKGFQGVIKRFGVKLLSHKAEKKRRKAGSLGPWHPAKLSYTTPLPGQMGFHTRTEFNKWLLRIGEGEEVNPKGGFLNYGLIRTKYVMLAGSVPGSRKRLVIMRKAIRPNKLPNVPPEIVYISRESKQGN